MISRTFLVGDPWRPYIVYARVSGSVHATKVPMNETTGIINENNEILTTPLQN